MAGFGNVSSALPMDTVDGKVSYIINPNNNVNHVGQNDDQITIIGAFEEVSTLAADASGTNTIQLHGYASRFNTGNNRYICIGGIETHTITNISDNNTITLSNNLRFHHASGTPVYQVIAITYQLRWDHDRPTMPILTRENITRGGGSFAVGENIENLQFTYVLTDGTETDSPANPGNIRMINVTVTARTNMPDPDLGGGDGFRRRLISSNIQLRNMGLNP